MKCTAQIAAERIRDHNLTEKEILTIEGFLRRCISNCRNLNVTLNKHLVDKKRDADEKNDPTKTEEDKKAQGKRAF